jgi:hypothetical protein
LKLFGVKRRDFSGKPARDVEELSLLKRAMEEEKKQDILKQILVSFFHNNTWHIQYAHL